MNPMFPARFFGKALGWSTMKLHVRGAADMEFRLAGSDIRVLRQVFVKRSYDFTKYPQYKSIADAYRKILDLGKIPVFVDGGANIGASAIWFAIMFPDAVVLAVEPDHDNAALCRRNCAPFPNIRVVEAALGSTSGSAEIIDPSAQEFDMLISDDNLIYVRRERRAA